MQEQLKAKKLAVPTHVYAVEELDEAERDLHDIDTLEGQKKGLGTALSKLTKAVREKGSIMAEANARYVKARPEGSTECKIAALNYNEKQAKIAEALTSIQKLKAHLEALDDFRAADQKISIVIKKFEAAQDELKAANKAEEGVRQELIAIQEEIDGKRKLMKKHIHTAFTQHDSGHRPDRHGVDQQGHRSFPHNGLGRGSLGRC
jgi:hypothetical protein